MVNTRLDKEISELQLDVHKIVYILENQHDIPNETSINWMNSLLKLPFSLQSVLHTNEMETLKHMLYTHIKESRSTPDKKLAIKNMALFINNLLVNNLCDPSQLLTCKYTQDNNTADPDCSILDLKFNAIDYYALINQISVLFPMIIESIPFPDIKEEEGIIISRYKIKILSRTVTYKTAVTVFNYLLGFLNLKNLRFGWTLSKALFRISRFCSQEKLSEQLIQRLEGEILGNEQSWINLLTLFALLSVNGTHVDSLSSGCLKALGYFKDYEPRSENVRESALFLEWARIRLGVYPSKDEMTMIVWIALFDSSYRCRRAASAVLQEYLGRFNSVFTIKEKYNSKSCDYREVCDRGNGGIYDKINEEVHDKKNKNTFEYAKDNYNISFNDNNNLKNNNCLDKFLSEDKISLEFIDKLSLESKQDGQDIQVRNLVEEFCLISEKTISSNLRRIQSSFETFLNFGCPEFFEKHVISLLSDLDFERRVIAAASASLFYNIRDFSRTDFSLSLNGYHLLLYFSNKLGSCMPLRDDEPFDIQKYYQSRHFDSIALVYLKIHQFVNSESLKKNVKFLVEKNYHRVRLIAEVVAAILQKDYTLQNDDTCDQFGNEIYKLVNRNLSGLCANSANKQHWKDIKKLYFNNLLNGKKIPETLRAIQISTSKLGLGNEWWTAEDINSLVDILHKFLNDYSLDSTGDAGFILRKEAFQLIWNLKEWTDIGGYLVRFLADKSKKLRDVVTDMLTNEVIMRSGKVAGGMELGEVGLDREEMILENVYEIAMKKVQGRTTVSKTDIENNGPHTTTFPFLSNDLSNELEQFITEKTQDCRIQERTESEENSPKSLDEMHFEALFKVFGPAQNRDFVVGIINTISSADSVLFKFIYRHISSALSCYRKVAYEILEDGSPFLLSSMKFLLRISDRSEGLRERLSQLDFSKMNKTEQCVKRTLMGTIESLEVPVCE